MSGLIHEVMMTKDTLPLPVPDLSTFARSLRKELALAPDLPGHLALMNMAARAAGFRNVQHLRACGVAKLRLDAPEAHAVPAPIMRKSRRSCAILTGRGVWQHGLPAPPCSILRCARFGRGCRPAFP